MGREPQVETGQWRKLSTGEPFRVGDAKKIGNTEGRIVHFLDKRTGWQNNTTLASRILATPGEALDEKLLTLTREQRARVKVCDWGIRVDDVWINGGTAAKSWWMRTDVHTDIDRMLARLDEALSKTAPTPPAQQTEPVRVGQWRIETVGERTVLFVERVWNSGAIDYKSFDGRLFMEPAPGSTFREKTRLATPREVLEAKLLTLPDEQRARVTISVDTKTGYTRLMVDGVKVDEANAQWMGRKFSDPRIDAFIDNMLTVIDAALSRPAPAPSRTEAIRAWCAGKPNITIDAKEGSPESGHRLTVAVDGRYIGVWWYPKEDTDPKAKSAKDIIACIDAFTVSQATPSRLEEKACTCMRCAPAGEPWHTAPCEKPTAPEGGAQPFRLGPDGWTDGPRTSWEKERDSLRSQLAAMTAEHNALKLWRDGYRQSSEDATNRLTEVLAERDALAALNAELRADVGRMAARVKALEAHMQLVRDLAAIPSKRAVNIFDEVANLTRRIAMRWGHSDGSVTEPEKGTVGTSHECPEDSDRGTTVGG